MKHLQICISGEVHWRLMEIKYKLGAKTWEDFCHKLAEWDSRGLISYPIPIPDEDTSKASKPASTERIT